MLRAETGQLPELKRVIAAYGDHVVMDETLPGALALLFKETVPASPPPGAPDSTLEGTGFEPSVPRGKGPTLRDALVLCDGDSSR
jgi:uncharacterized membrane protein (UPF0182 family)